MSRNYREAMAEDVRLVILQELASQIDGRLSSRMLAEAVYAAGHNTSPEYLINQLAELEEVGATKNIVNGDIVIAEITKLGVKHVLRQVKLKGVRELRLGA